MRLLRNRSSRRTGDGGARRPFAEVIGPGERIRRAPSRKRMAVPVRKLLPGAEPVRAASPDVMQNPSSLDFVAAYAKAISYRP